MEITSELDCVLVCQFTVSFLCQNYVIYAFITMTYFHDVRITFFCGTLALHMEITLKLRSVFLPYCDVFFVMSQLCFLFVGCRITLHFGTFELSMEMV